MKPQPNNQVGPHQVERIKAHDPDNPRFFVPAARPGHALFDLGGFIVERLRQARVGQIEDLALCTYADPARFYSYRRTTHRAEPDYGRHINAIALGA
jgi:copper oxidase (laccase) domain-containing protein